MPTKVVQTLVVPLRRDMSAEVHAAAVACDVDVETFAILALRVALVSFKPPCDPHGLPPRGPIGSAQNNWRRVLGAWRGLSPSDVG